MKNNRMNSGDRNLDRIERKLFSAWRMADAEPGEKWQEKLMEDIYSEAEERYVRQPYFNGIAWRVSVAAGIAAFILLVHSIYSGIVPDMDISALFIIEPGGFFISPPFGMI